MKILKWDEKFRIKQPDGSEKEIRVEDIRLDAQSFMACGTAIGSCGVIVMDNTVDIVEALANLNQFYAHESCGQCTPCREGTLWMSRITRRICEGWGRPEDVDLLAPEEGIIQGVVSHLIFKGVHYEMEVQANGFEWLVHSTDLFPVGQQVGIHVDPFDIQIMNKPESEDEEALGVNE